MLHCSKKQSLVCNCTALWGEGEDTTVENETCDHNSLIAHTSLTASFVWKTYQCLSVFAFRFSIVVDFYQTVFYCIQKAIIEAGEWEGWKMFDFIQAHAGSRGGTSLGFLNCNEKNELRYYTWSKAAHWPFIWIQVRASSLIWHSKTRLVLSFHVWSDFFEPDITAT